MFHEKPNKILFYLQSVNKMGNNLMYATFFQVNNKMNYEVMTIRWWQCETIGKILIIQLMARVGLAPGAEH